MNALVCNPEPDGHAPEERRVICGIGWEGHLALDQKLGDDRPDPRFYYLDGELEIMSTSDEHERIRKWLSNCMEIYSEESEIEDLPRGQATLRLVAEAGAEPDESWCLDDWKKFPDIVLEIALTSGGLPKLRIYQRFAIPEVWIWRMGRLEIHCLSADGSGYEENDASGLLPTLPIAALERAVAMPRWSVARRTFREALR